MATRAVLLPISAEFKTSTFPALLQLSDAAGARKVLAFDAATDEAAYWTFVAPVGWTAPLYVVISYAMASATSGNTIWDVAVEAVASGDATDLDAGESLDTANTSAADAVPGTAGYLKQVTVTLTTHDSSVANDMIRLRIRRVGSSGSDTATGDAYLLVAEVRDTL